MYKNESFFDYVLNDLTTLHELLHDADMKLSVELKNLQESQTFKDSLNHKSKISGNATGQTLQLSRNKCMAKGCFEVQRNVYEERSPPFFAAALS